MKKTVDVSFAFKGDGITFVTTYSFIKWFKPHHKENSFEASWDRKEYKTIGRFKIVGSQAGCFLKKWSHQ